MNTTFARKPYIIIPKLIKQPTWGGKDFIMKSKNWLGNPRIKAEKIGQSYELFSRSKVRLDISETTDPTHIPEIGNPDNDQIETDQFTLTQGKEYVEIQEVTARKIPILIKITQALGNSFQLHIKPGTASDKWRPKPEAWYYFDDGLITCGLKPGADLNRYKNVCEAINNQMVMLSGHVTTGQMTLEQARAAAKEFIKGQNPWQFVNTFEVKKGDFIDMSAGGIHHSWEDNMEKCPNGNVLYEIQADEMDPVSTIRAFDQGKIKDDGSIRLIHIKDYFTYIDTDPARNDINNLKKHPTDPNDTLVNNATYTLKLVTTSTALTDQTNDSFVHLYVREGKIKVSAVDGSVTVTAGHSCFLPQEVGEFQIEAVDGQAVLLKSHI